MTKIAFIGLGQMGSPMAGRLLEAGHDLTVWNRTAERAGPLARLGARAAESPAEAAAGADVVVTMLADPSALEEVLFGSGGLAGALSPGQVLVDSSTVGPDEIRSVAERVPEGVAVVDAPVRGSVGEAENGLLIVLVGGHDDEVARVEPILSTFGTVERVGGPGSGAAMKLVVNSTLGAAIAGVGEAIALGDVLGLDRERVLDVLSSSPLGEAFRGKRSNIEAGSYPPRFKLGLALKDLRLVNGVAERAGRTLRSAAASRDWLALAEEEGKGDLDYSAVVATITGGPASG
jgi:3-hydroxyisobutyrate dehydrogenase-like beta-hydroxyacid dehydrogenase